MSTILLLCVNRLTFSDTDDKKVITVEPHIIPNRGPYVYNQPKRCSFLSQTCQVFNSHVLFALSHVVYMFHCKKN